MKQPGQLPPRVFHLLLALMALAAFVWYNYISFTQLRANLVFTADAGVFDYVCASLRHGQFLRYPLAWNADANYFAGHFRPILLIIMPFYYLHDGMMTYLSFQNFFLVGAVVPLCLYARRLLRNDLVSLLIGLLYLGNHFVRSVHLANHPEAIGFFGFFCMFLALELRRTWLYIAGFLWVCLVKEEMSLYLAAFSISLLFERDTYKTRVALYSIPAAVVVWTFAHLSMQWSGAANLHEAGVKPLSRFADMGDSKVEIVVYALTHPFNILGRIFRMPLLLLFLSTGLLALADWRAFWLTIMGGAMFMVTSDAMVRELLYYYSYPAIPFLFYSTVRGAVFLLHKSREWSPGNVYTMAGWLLLATAAWLPVATRTDNYPHRPFPIEPHHRLADEIARLIPDQVPVSVQYDLYAKVANRPVKLPLRLEYLDQVDWVFFNFSPTGRPADLWGEEKRDEFRQVVKIVFSDEFETVFEGDGYYLRKRRAE